jgi:segregation and condensation protein A
VASPLASIYGQPLTQLPLDLYIPPDAMAVMLDAFEGPLDLLLYLIRKANVNVLDIPMAPLTAQYLVYVEAMRTQNLELAADYLVMAAMLIEIKSRMLLPRPKADGRRRGRGSARRTGAPPDRVRADEIGRAWAQ